MFDELPEIRSIAKALGDRLDVGAKPVRGDLRLVGDALLDIVDEHPRGRLVPIPCGIGADGLLCRGQGGEGVEIARLRCIGFFGLKAPLFFPT